MMKSKCLMKMIIACSLLVILSGVIGCSSNNKKAGDVHLQGIVNDFASWDNSIARAKKLHKEAFKPAKEAFDNYNKEINDFYKANKDNKARLAKREELGKKYFDSIKNLLDKIPKEADTIKLDGQRVRYCAAYVKAVTDYMEGSSLMNSKDNSLVSKGHRMYGEAGRRIFDSQLGYNHAYSLATDKIGTYELTENNFNILQVGKHSYYTVASVFKMPGKFIRTDTVIVNNKPIKQDLYIWAYKEAYVVAVFRNGVIVSLQKEGLW